jgi:CheY-like chemotaxis protein
MSGQFTPITVLMADDDPDDRLMTQEAWEENRIANTLVFVNDGEELMDYLYHRGRHSDPKTSPRPGLILLDLNMPKKDGREALKEIKADPNLGRIPIVVITTSNEEEEIVRSYDLGVNSFLSKPVTFDELVKMIQVLSEYWLEIVRLPGHKT